MKLLIAYPDSDDSSSIISRLRRGFNKINQSGSNKLRTYQLLAVLLNKKTN